MDLPKAFDCIPHDLLTRTLENARLWVLKQELDFLLLIPKMA